MKNHGTSPGVKDFLDILCGPEKKAPAEAGDMSRGHLSPTKWGRTWGRPWDLLVIWWDFMGFIDDLMGSNGDIMGGIDEYLIAKAAIW